MTTTPTPVERMLAVLPEPLRAVAAQRLAGAEPVLRQRLAGLYGERADFLPWLGELMENIGRLHAARPAALHQQDALRAAQPDWFLGQQMLGYCAYVQRFGGTLNGVGERIAHLQELGVSYLHLLPFLRPRAGENDGGFAVANFDQVDPALGSNADLEALTARLRGAGISLCSDFILNHVADDHAWAQGARAGDPALRAMFHVFPDRALPDRYEQTLGQVFPQAAPGNFSHVEELGGWVWTTFYPYQWDLNYANPAVFAEMAAALLRLANRGIEVFRLDSTAFLWKREGTNCMNQPEAHALLQALRAVVAIAAPGVLLKAEAIVPTRQLPAYFGSAAAPECHIAYHSSLMAAGWAALAEQDAGLLRQVIAATPALPPAASWLSYVRCHDDIGWNVLRDEAGAADDPTAAAARLARIARFFSGADGSYAAGAAFQSSDPHAAHGSNGMAASLAGLETARDAEQRAAARRRLLLLHGLALSFGALPVLYMGDELAQQNDYSYTTRPQHAMDSRWLQRPEFDLQRWAGRDDPHSEAGQVYAALRQLVRLRRRLPELAAGAPLAQQRSGDPALLALARGARFLALFNFSAQPRGMALDGRWTVLQDDRVIESSVTLEPYGMLWLARTDDAVSPQIPSMAATQGTTA
ncbi:alpha-amylase family glycosyl hydrolase [Rugamonas rubra]|nr:alpha-amylase family glycosyl hydrolase [Rugamonas rubra]